MQDFSELQELCEKHKQIVNIINIINEGLNTNEPVKELTVMVTGGSKVKIDVDPKKPVDRQVLYSLLNGFKQVERELSQKVNNFFNHN